MNRALSTLWRPLGILTVAMCSGLLVGYITTVIAGVLPIINKQFNLDVWQQGVLVSIILVGGFLGSLLCNRIIPALGHKKTLTLVALAFIAGSVWSALSVDFLSLLSARFFVGLAVGITTVIAPMYTAETASDNSRGFLVSSVQLAITIGILLAYVISYYFAPTQNWQMMFALGTLPALLLLIIVPLQLESPRWLFLKNRVDEAKSVFFKLHGIKWAELEIIQPPIETHCHFRELLHPIIFPVLLFACGLFLFQNLSGIDAILYYAPIIFTQSGFTSLQSGLAVAILIGIINILATLLSMWLIDHLGRRPITIIGLLFMTLSLIGFSFFHPYIALYPAMRWISALMLLLFVMSFAVSMGPIPYVLMSELFPIRLRTIGMGIASATAWGINALVTFAYPILIEYIGISRLFLGFAFVCAIALFICLLFCPETKNQTLEAIEKRLLDGVKLRNLGTH
ncbi:sugar porter family MFS transporter [Legionella anisa]|uniref:MFS transporter n=1 Tax=Legionella anisa TaxID=28082 RepID=A0AAX0WPK9_9GAMM|nr:sugar porter family MFS transporter [Legionella anisa]AWN73204.1 MFS transporter [Legionella anisa]KTC69479.1 D-xylose proton symporter [Legionella anisa]MBN5934782.1 sugar porter family MFS transporter [Legionella anisa]MCW8424040.1 sugar porter family MFS transporter [Legionella anisa]MCW8447565.1 sugar porter family MFS transporter [Legionella anisa]